MTRERVVTGFHRLGLVLAILCAVPAAVGVAIAMFGNPASPSGALMFTAALLIASGVIYSLCRALAWIVTGFMHE